MTELSERLNSNVIAAQNADIRITVALRQENDPRYSSESRMNLIRYRCKLAKEIARARHGLDLYGKAYKIRAVPAKGGTKEI